MIHDHLADSVRYAMFTSRPTKKSIWKQLIQFIKLFFRRLISHRFPVAERKSFDTRKEK